MAGLKEDAVEKELDKVSIGDSINMSVLEFEMNKRLQNFIFVASYEEYVAAFSNEKYFTALKLLQVCELARPEAAWINYLMARVYALSDDDKKALKQLEISVEKGYSNISDLNNNKNFDVIRNNKRFKLIVEKKSK